MLAGQAESIMAEFLSLKVKNLDKLTKLAQRYPKIAEKHINLGIRRALVRIFAEEKKEAPFGVTGNLRDRWTIAVQRFQGVLKSGVDYAVAVEKGTRPHRVRITRGFISWAEHRGINPYAVANSISKKGTKANPFFKRAIAKSQRGVQQEFTNAIRNITKDLAK